MAALVRAPSTGIPSPVARLRSNHCLRGVPATRHGPRPPARRHGAPSPQHWLRARKAARGGAGVAVAATSADVALYGSDGSGPPAEAMYGYYSITPEDQATFDKLDRSMSNAIKWFYLVGIAETAFPILNFLRFGVKPHLIDVFVSAESLILGSLFVVGRASFRKLKTLEKDRSGIPVMIEGIQRLILAFLQMASLSIAVTFLQTMRAASDYPAVVTPFTTGLILVAALRGLALRTIVTRYEPGSCKMEQLIAAVQRGKAEEYPLLDRFSLRLVGGPLLGYTSPGQEPDVADGSQEYEFSDREENMVRAFLDSLRTASSAMAFQAISNVVRAIVAINEMNYSEIFDSLRDTVESGVASLVMFGSASRFDGVVSTQGRDITHIMDGFGSKGLTKLFHELAGLSKGVLIATLVSNIVLRLDRWHIEPLVILKKLAANARALFV